jgi:hypothetical protein
MVKQTTIASRQELKRLSLKFQWEVSQAFNGDLLFFMFHESKIFSTNRDQVWVQGPHIQYPWHIPRGNCTRVPNGSTNCDQLQ